MIEMTEIRLADFAKERIGVLLEDVVREARRAERDTSQDGVHDLRVAIRRLSENLKVFSRVFPKGSAKVVRNDLKSAMRLAGEARNHDIAADLMRKAGVAVDPEVENGRLNAARGLSGVLAGWNAGVTFRAWKEELHV